MPITATRRRPRTNPLGYEATLHAARKVGASKANDAQQIALLCENVLQRTCGAVSPSLVFEGAMKKNLTATQFSKMMADDPQGVEDLMWA